MKEITNDNFGLLIAYVLPGFTALWGMSYLWQPIRVWLGATPANAPTVGGFLYVTLASVAVGVTVSTVRWAVLDSIHHWTGIRQPEWDFSRLQDNFAAYNVLNDIHYKYYLFHGNHLIAILFLFVARRIRLGFFTAPLGWLDVGCLFLVVLLFLGSRDAISKYYSRVSHFLNQPRSPTAVANDQPITGHHRPDGQARH